MYVHILSRLYWAFIYPKKLYTKKCNTMEPSAKSANALAGVVSIVGQASQLCVLTVLATRPGMRSCLMG